MRANVSQQLPADVQDPMRILVAEDNEFLREAMRGIFRLLGYTVDVVANGREAVEAASRREYELVFLDIQMPEMNGLDAARSIRSDSEESGRARIRIVGLSAEAGESTCCEAAGMDDYLLKPVVIDDLVGVLNQLPRSRRESVA